jgi:hypothetical protein
MTSIGQVYEPKAGGHMLTVKKLFFMAVVTQFRGQWWGSIVEDILILRLNTTTNNSSKMSFGYDTYTDHL